jgi:hypothetical protein
LWTSHDGDAKWNRARDTAGRRIARRRVIRVLGTPLLAGVAGGLWAGLVAHALGVSVAIAAGVAGTLLAVVVAAVRAKYGRAP